MKKRLIGITILVLVMLALALAPTVEALISIFTPPNEPEGPRGLKWKNHPMEHVSHWLDVPNTRIYVYRLGSL